MKQQEKYKINAQTANTIYEDNFLKNFSFEKDAEFSMDYEKVTYIENDEYYIGYTSKLDKRGTSNPHINYLAKINSETGEISVVK